MSDIPWNNEISSVCQEMFSAIDICVHSMGRSVLVRHAKKRTDILVDGRPLLFYADSTQSDTCKSVVLAKCKILAQLISGTDISSEESLVFTYQTSTGALNIQKKACA